MQKFPKSHCVTEPKSAVEKYLLRLLEYSKLPHEGIVVNTFAMVLVALGILVSYAVRSPVLRVDTKVYVTERL